MSSKGGTSPVTHSEVSRPVSGSPSVSISALAVRLARAARRCNDVARILAVCLSVCPRKKVVKLK